MWNDAKGYPFEEGKLFLGLDPDTGCPVGIKTERHAITVAGARSGKGVAVIIPNLLLWPQNALVIDPKGEAAAATWEAREAMGQAVHVLDPFGRADVPDRLRSRFNPLDTIDTGSQTVREDIKALADGLVVPTDPKAAHWEGGALDVVAGFIAYVASMTFAEGRNLGTVRQLLADPDIGKTIEAMNGKPGCGGLMNAAAGRMLRTGGEAAHFISGANANTAWLDSDPMREALAESSFQLSDLKTKPCTVFLVLPPEELEEHSRFLRLFVRAALRTMPKNQGDRRCLFILDEFYSLGYIGEIAKAAGLMPGYGVQLWPILQDLGQITSLYGQEGGETFFGNADVHQYFGNTDNPTLGRVTASLGVTDINEIPMPPAAYTGTGLGIGQAVGSMGSSAMAGPRNRYASGWSLAGGAISAVEGVGNAVAQANYQNKMNEYQREMAKIGRPRLALEEVASIIQKKNDIISDHMICFVHGRERLLLKLAPYFRHDFEAMRKRGADTDTADNAVPSLAQHLVGFGFLFGIIIGLVLLGLPDTNGPVWFMFVFGAVLGLPIGLLVWGIRKALYSASPKAVLD